MNDRVLRLLYVLTFLLATSCQWEQMNPKIDCSTSPVVIATLEVQASQCDSPVGSFAVAASGGEPPYTFTSAGKTNVDGIFANMEAGSYIVVATDANDCTDELSVSIENTGGVNLTEVITNNAGCGTTDGSIRVNATGGMEPYSYQINNGEVQIANTFEGLGLGTYSVAVIDQNGCESAQSVEINSGVSYEASIKSIIENNCAISGCHNGSVSPNLTSFSTIQSRASSIKTKTGNKSMPKGSSLSQQQIDLISCWVNDGALNN